jgi:RecA-family ATPase
MARIQEDNFEDPDIERPTKKARPEPNGAGEGSGPVIELKAFDPADWVSDPEPEERKHIVENYILDETTTLLSGDGGTGKSYIAHQLVVAMALGREWIGLPPEPGKTKSIYLSCEDNLAEMKRRQRGILRFHDADWGDLRPGSIKLVDLVGEDSILAALKSGIIEPTQMFCALDALMTGFGPDLTVIDVLAATFAGNEVVRTEVRQFANLLNGLCKKHRSAILLLAHPSLTGMSTGTGLSGSTDWNNGFRCRIYLDSVTNKDGSELERKFRILRGMKNNYGEPGGKITLEWKKGLYVPVRAASGSEKVIEDAKVDDAFVKLVLRFNAQDRNASEKVGTSYAPSLFAKEPDAGFNREQFEGAMRRLLLANKIRIEDHGRKGKPARTFIPFD